MYMFFSDLAIVYLNSTYGNSFNIVYINSEMFQVDT